jgi:hypothetical protein
MITGVVPPDWLDKLESICGAKEEIDGGRLRGRQEPGGSCLVYPNAA